MAINISLWDGLDSNQQPSDYESPALTLELPSLNCAGAPLRLAQTSNTAHQFPSPRRLWKLKITHIQCLKALHDFWN